MQRKKKKKKGNFYFWSEKLNIGCKVWQIEDKNSKMMDRIIQLIKGTYKSMPANTNES